MSFGQPSGAPASARKVRELLGLLQEAGYADFRDARGPMGLTQRQGNGKFTAEEAQALIDQLLDEQHQADVSDEPPPRSLSRPAPQGRELAKVPAEQLAAELQRRGWVVMAP